MPHTCQTPQSASRNVAELNRKLGELESLPQPTVAYGRDLGAGEVLPFHSHRRAQLVYASEGTMQVRTSEAAYVVLPNQAVWVPSEILHEIEARTALAMRTLYLDQRARSGLPDAVCVLQVTPLLRELVLAAVEAGAEYLLDSPAARLGGVILDQICAQPAAPLALPTPRDPRLKRVTAALSADPADNRDFNEWARLTGASARTLARLFSSETGMSFRDWRERCRLLHGLQRLAAGASVTEVALDLGYSNASAFIAMFRRNFGTTPAKYIASRSVSNP